MTPLLLLLAGCTGGADETGETGAPCEPLPSLCDDGVQCYTCGPCDDGFAGTFDEVYCRCYPHVAGYGGAQCSDAPRVDPGGPSVGL